MKRALLWLTAALAVPSAVLAVSTKSFVFDSSEAFEKGKFEGTAYQSRGALTRGIRTSRVALEGAAVAYTSSIGPDGAIYVGTGNEGAIYRVTREGAKLFADTEAAVVTSLVWADGVLYAGTLPGGKIYAIDAKGNVRERATLADAEHIWALSFDEKKRTLYAATGPQGKLFALEGQAAPKLIYDDVAEHLLCLDQDAQGRLYVGTSNGARLVRIEGKDARVLYDFPGQEITALDVGPSFIAVASSEFPEPPNVSSDATKDTNPRLRRPKPGKGKAYQLGFNGLLKEVYDSDAAHISALEIDTQTNAILVGIAQEGRVFRVAENGDRALWADAEERQVVALALGASVPHFVTSDGVAVYRVESQGGEAQWTSAVLDAKVPARFGELSFRAQGAVQWATRSGNTETPDDSCTAWSAASKQSGPIKSPGARFLQLQFKLAENAELYAANAYYLPQNQPAQITKIRLKPAKPDPKASLPAHKSVLSLAWDVSNPDEDKLRYRLYYRNEQHSAWLPMLREQDRLEQADYDWETRSLPDGYYRVRVEASDEASNPPALVERSEALSAPLLVDNHGPEIVGLQLQGKQLVGVAKDSLGPILQLDVSIDGAPFEPVFPVDGLLDTREERFAIDLSQLPEGTHIGAVRASDSAYNVSVSSIEFKLGR